MSRFKRLFGLLLFACLFNVQAAADETVPSCEFSPQPVVANYTVISRSLRSADERNNGSQFTLSLWREGNRNGRVAHSFTALQQSEVWNRLSNGLLRAVKHFDADARAIEYESIDLDLPRVENAWTSKYNLIPDALYTQVTDVATEAAQSSSSCEFEYSYHDLQRGIRYDVVWNRQWQLPASLTVFSDKGQGRVITQWRLDSIEDNKMKVARRFERWDSHAAIDFADIGDNESDPFIMKMRNLGFLSHGASGIYDSSGRLLSTGHRH